MFRLKTLVLLLCMAVVPLWAQDGGQDGAGIDNTQSAPSQTPLLNQSTLAYSSELERTNYVIGGVSLRSTFDDNVLNTTVDRMSNFAYYFLPFVELDQSRSRLSWKLNYAGGFVMNQHLASGNQASHDFGLQGQYRLSPHVTLALRDRFFNTTGFYDQVNQTSNHPTGGLLQQSNQFVITPLARQVGNSTAAQLEYQFARDSKVGASGSFDLLHYRDVPVGTTLVDTQGISAQAYYNHRLVGQNWFGISYRYQKLSFSPLANRTFVHSILLTDTIYITHTVTLALFAGPEQVNDLIAHVPGVTFPANGLLRSNWSVTAGGSFNWNGERTGFIAGGSRMVSDGGGLGGAVQLISANAGVRHQWSESFSTQFGVMYGNNGALSTLASPYSSLKMVSSNFSVTRTLGNTLLLTLGYARDLQRQSHSITGLGNVNHNRAWATVAYNFKRPLGR